MSLQCLQRSTCATLCHSSSTPSHIGTKFYRSGSQPLLGLIEISAFFAMEANLTKKRGRGRPRGSTNANVTRCRINLRRAQYAVQREIDMKVQLDSLGVLEEVLRHFYLKARVLETLGTEGDYDAVDRAWTEAGKWAREVANFRHPKVASIRLAGDPNKPLLPQDMTLDQLRELIIVDLERLRETGVLDLPQLTQGVVNKS